MNTVTFFYSTAPDQSTARKIAESLVGNGAAACVNLIPGMTSVYRWEGKVEIAEEVVMIVKSTADARDDVRAIISSLHPYSTPAIAAIEIKEPLSSPEFCGWVKNSCGR